MNTYTASNMLKIYLIHIFDELVNILEVHVSVFKLEVVSKGQHNVVGLVVLGLVLNHGNKGVHTVWNIVCLLRRVILWVEQWVEHGNYKEHICTKGHTYGSRYQVYGGIFISLHVQVCGGIWKDMDVVMSLHVQVCEGIIIWR